MTVRIELMLACDIKADAPEQVRETLKYLTRKENYEFNNPPLHSFFESGTDVVEYQGWRNIFQYDTDPGPMLGPILYDFPGVWVKEYYEGKFTVRIEIGSYTAEFLDGYLPFLDWLAPYIKTEGHFSGAFIGYIQGGNTHTGSLPALLFCKDGKIYFSATNNSLQELNEDNLDRLFYGQNFLKEEK